MYGFTKRFRGKIQKPKKIIKQKKKSKEESKESMLDESQFTEIQNSLDIFMGKFEIIENI